jgi:hypothetical protein
MTLPRHLFDTARNICGEYRHPIQWQSSKKLFSSCGIQSSFPVNAFFNLSIVFWRECPRSPYRALQMASNQLELHLHFDLAANERRYQDQDL